MHGGVAQSHRLPGAPEGEPDVGHADPGPGHPVVGGQALGVQALGWQLVTVWTDRGELKPLLHDLQQLVNQVITVSVSKKECYKFEKSTL